jgi:Sel1 repeat
MIRFAVLFTMLFSGAALFAQTTPDISSLKAKSEAGDAVSQLTLARAYAKGRGIRQNDELAAKWFRAAAEQGNAEAQSELGVLYRLGEGVPRDKEEAVKWYRKAAKQGFGPAMYNLAIAYYNGDGVGISDSYAYAWFVLAQRAGSKEAPEAVARMESELLPAKLIGAKLQLASLLKSTITAAHDLFTQGQRRLKRAAMVLQFQFGTALFKGGQVSTYP